MFSVKGWSFRWIMSRIMRKSAFCLCKIQRLDQLAKSKISSTSHLLMTYSPDCWGLVWNPEDRFSCYAALIKSDAARNMTMNRPQKTGRSASFFFTQCIKLFLYTLQSYLVISIILSHQVRTWFKEMYTTYFWQASN